MDVIVADIPPRYGIFLSRSWGAKLGGTLQLEFSYVTIPIFGKLRKLYQESKMKYMISSWENTNNHPIHVFHTDLDSIILFNDECSASFEVLIEEKAENSEFSNYVLEMENAEIYEKVPSGLEPTTLLKKMMKQWKNQKFLVQ